MTDSDTSLQPDHPDVLIKPPYMFGGALVFSCLLEMFWGGDIFSWGVQFFLGCIMLASGGVLMAVCLSLFNKNQTNISPHRSTTTLITAGPYRYSRNPIYIGLFLLYAGLCVLFDIAWGYALGFALFYVMNRFVIDREESYLARKFGAEYLDYKIRVRRWL